LLNEYLRRTASARRSTIRGSWRSHLVCCTRFGFAGALAEVGLPQSSIPIALLFFNVGVEIGQLLFVGAVLTVIAAGWRAGRRLRSSQPVWIWRIAPHVIGGLASFWLVERVAAF
jgi:hypothetical protein